MTQQKRWQEQRQRGILAEYLVALGALRERLGEMNADVSPESEAVKFLAWAEKKAEQFDPLR